MKKENHFLGLKESLFFFFLFQKILHMLQRKMKDFRILCCTAAACMRAHIRTFPRMFPRQAKLKSPQVMFLMFFFTFYFEKEMSSSKPFWTVGWKWICTQLSFSCVLYSTYPMSLIRCVLQNSNFLARDPCQETQMLTTLEFFYTKLLQISMQNKSNILLIIYPQPVRKLKLCYKCQLL